MYQLLRNVIPPTYRRCGGWQSLLPSHFGHNGTVQRLPCPYENMHTLPARGVVSGISVALTFTRTTRPRARPRPTLADHLRDGLGASTATRTVISPPGQFLRW